MKQDNSRSAEEMQRILANRQAFFAHLQTKWGVSCGVAPEQAKALAEQCEGEPV